MCIRDSLSDDSATDGKMGSIVEAVVISKSAGVFCGRIPVDLLFAEWFPSCELTWNVEEGGDIKVGSQILSISGPSDSVLSCERVVLNILGRLSGITTRTSEWVSESGDVSIACTRKTAWGLMDKWAVHMGGGLTHRLSRTDALMIKENDLSVIGSKDGIELGMAVMDKSYLIGKVVEVSFTSSRVLLLSDLNSKVPVDIMPNNIQSILSGTGGDNGIIQYTRQQELIENDAIVFTSGAGGLFKSGIPIGTIFKDPNNSDINVKFFSDFSQLRFVKIISFKEELK